MAATEVFWADLDRELRNPIFRLRYIIEARRIAAYDTKANKRSRLS